jgi:hypothetical protein
MTICWHVHVDDLKVSHEDPAEVTAFGEWLSEMYGVTIATHRGKVHEYLGMILDYSCKGKIMVNMTEHIKSIILDFLEEITTKQATPDPCSQSSFQGYGRQQFSAITGGAGLGIPSHSGQSSVSECTGAP